MRDQKNTEADEVPRKYSTLEQPEDAESGNKHNNKESPFRVLSVEWCINNTRIHLSAPNTTAVPRFHRTVGQIGVLEPCEEV